MGKMSRHGVPETRGPCCVPESRVHFSLGGIAAEMRHKADLQRV